jgi:hypothetical protein
MIDFVFTLLKQINISRKQSNNSHYLALTATFGDVAAAIERLLGGGQP